MKSFLTFYFTTFLFLSVCFSQVSSYDFTEFTGAYRPIITNSTLGDWNGTLSGQASSNSVSISMPFGFCMGGSTFAAGSPLTMTHDGWAAFGNVTTTSTNRIIPLTSFNNVMSVFGTDLITSGSSTYGAKVEGSAPNRVLVLQWGDNNISTFWKRYTNGHAADRLHFQIRLYETSGVIEFHYLITNYNNNNGGSVTNVQVGLRGASASDFNVRTKTGNTAWNNNSTAASSLSSTMNFNNRTGQNPSQLIRPSGTLTSTGSGSTPGTGTGTIFRWRPSPTGTPGVASTWTNCYNPLPVALSNFKALLEGRVNLVKWETHSEWNNDHFILQTSTDLNDWGELGYINGMGNSSTTIDYEFIHENPSNIQYYRLFQVDFDGTSTLFDPIVIERKIAPVYILRKVNLLGQEIDEYYNGIVIIQFSDGSVKKTVQ